jgi:selenocysteine lyase/cysteine desulfurase
MQIRDLRFDTLREQIVGVDSTFTTPFGERMLVYCDYTASGRCLRFVERYLVGLQRHYANTHTEDDVTGRSMTQLLHEAERSIKRSVNAGPNGRIIACGTGATAAIDKLQQMIGVAISPATRALLLGLVRESLTPEGVARLEEHLKRRRPLVFVGPYEHHSNEVTWREGLAEVVEVDLAPDGSISLAHLESVLRDPRCDGRLRIGSFSAASNVTGMISPVHEIARLLHRRGALACFDYAASAPYVRIDMNPDPGPEGGDPSLDAVFISPHKFLGGPGSCGVLVFNDRIYHRELPPTVGGGGTVSYVGYDGQDFLTDIEEREKAGTPGVLQMLKAALAFQIKRAVGEERIAAREEDLVARAMGRWADNPRIEILGNSDPRRRIGIVSFNVKDRSGRYLHPKFVTTLANDLFGIQSRAGCSCAGPYGHRLLGIDRPTSERYRAWIRRGYHGIKPGWCRVGFHYVMDDAEAEYVVDAVDFIGRRGDLFAPLYRFDTETGAWSHESAIAADEDFSLEAAWRAIDHGATALTAAERERRYRGYLAEAERWADRLAARPQPESVLMARDVEDLQYFGLPRVCARSEREVAG